MSDQKTVPKRLRENKVERGNFEKPPIPYIPVDDEIGEKVKSEARGFKVKIDDKSTVNASVWTGGNPEGFLIHVISALGYIERSKLYNKSNSAKIAQDKCAAELQDSRERVTKYLEIVRKKKNAQKEPQEESTEPATAPPAQAKRGKTDTPTVPAQKSKEDEIAEELAKLKKIHNGLYEAWKKAKEKKEEAGNAIFTL